MYPKLKVMPATLTPPKTAKRKPAVSQGLKRVATKKKKTEEVSWEELQYITKKLMKEGNLKPFEKKYVYGNL